jgi:hypothetical protein
MKTAARITALEKVQKAKTGKTIEVYICWPDYVMHNGERMTRAEFDALPIKPGDTVINVTYNSEERTE